MDINNTLEACNELDEKLAEENGQFDAIVLKHLSLVTSKCKFIVSDFNTDLQWFNVSEPLSLKSHLQGKIVVLDFFTYCCINCMHILPDLEALEEKYKNDNAVVVLGIHSAKFENEKDSANILSAILRYSIKHAVVNDTSLKLWSGLQIACWPTLVILGPNGEYLYHLIGEGHKERLGEFVREARQFFIDQISHADMPVRLEKLPDSKLLFPGKVCLGKNLVAVADSGHHQVIVADSRGLVKYVIGSSCRGSKDGRFSEAQFSSPQGLVLDGTTLYIADTDNHLIRKADFKTGLVETIAGTGCQGDDKEGGRLGPDQPISSPWDLCLGNGVAFENSSVLFIAMAGTHQIWIYFLKDSNWYKNQFYAAGTCMRFAGSGMEENRNNSYPEKAAFAQPSGIALSTTLQSVYIADSESSSVRSIQLKDGAVKNVVGGDIDPKNLFAFGDIDEVGTKAKLQHPLGVTMVTEDGPLLVADSYNHKIKSVDVKTRQCSTIVGTGKAGRFRGDNPLLTELNEPSGVVCDVEAQLVYIADTNNHDIKLYNLKSQKIDSFPLIFDPSVINTDFDLCGVSQGHQHAVKVTLKVMCKEGVHLNEEAPNTWILGSDDPVLETYLTSCGAKMKGELSHDAAQTLTSFPAVDDIVKGDVTLKLRLFVCEDSGVCRMDQQTLTIPVADAWQAKELAYSIQL